MNMWLISEYIWNCNNFKTHIVFQTRQTNQPGVSDPKSSPTSDGTEAQRQTGSSTTNEISLNLQQITINDTQNPGLLTVDSCHPGGHQTRSDSISVRHPGVTKSQMRGM